MPFLCIISLTEKILPSSDFRAAELKSALSDKLFFSSVEHDIMQKRKTKIYPRENKFIM